MVRNPSNTSIFLFAIYPYISQPQYRDNLRKTIKTIQGLGFDPYVVSRHEELLEDANLFISLKDRDITPMESTREYWRENILFLLDTIDFDAANLQEMLNTESAFVVYADYGANTTGIYCGNRGKKLDWVDWLRKLASKELGNVSRFLVMLKPSRKLDLPWPSMQ